MDLGHDTEHALGMVVDLVNDPPATLAELETFIDRHKVSGVGRLRPADLAALRELSERLGSVFDAVSGDLSAAVATLNSLVTTSGATPQLTGHDGLPLHLHFFAPTAALADHLAADGAMALAFVLVAGERDRLARCAAPGCNRVLIDLSRNRSRRYCDGRTCGNRLHVAAYRARRRATTGA